VTIGFHSGTPNMARVYDYWLGGKDHYAADRAEAQRLLAIYPPLRDLVRENRTFVTQAISWAARQGIGQFIDLGAGLPASPAVHQTARAVLPSTQIAYIDIDPVVLSHARALLAISDGVAAVEADLRDPAAVLADPQLRAVIDLREPVCVILAAVLHFLDADAARQVTAGYTRLIGPGSCLVISVACYDDEALGKRLSAEYTAATWHNHLRADVDSFFAGLDLVGPGVTEAQTWRAWMPVPVLRRREGQARPRAEPVRLVPAGPRAVRRVRWRLQRGTEPASAPRRRARSVSAWVAVSAACARVASCCACRAGSSALAAAWRARSRSASAALTRRSVSVRNRSIAASRSASAAAMRAAASGRP